MEKYGPRESGRIGRIIVHPTEPNIVYACVAGRLTGPQEERGVFRTKDGGQTWKRILFVDPEHRLLRPFARPEGPQLLWVAGTWEVVDAHLRDVQRRTRQRRLHHARWRRHLEAGRKHGMPKPPVGKIDVAIAPSAIPSASMRSSRPPTRARSGAPTMAAKLGRGELAARADRPRRLLHPPRRQPTNPDEVFVANSSFWGSTDAGKTFHSSPGAATPTISGSTPRSQPHPGHARRRHVHDHRSRPHFQPRDPAHRPDVPRRRGSTTCPTRSTATCRTTTPCAAPTTSSKPEPNVPRGRLTSALAEAARRGPMGTRPGRLRKRLHHSRPRRQQHCLGHMLRRRGHPLRCPH